MGWYLIVTENGIVTKPVQADDLPTLLGRLREEAQGMPFRAAAIELTAIGDLAADGTAAQTFVDSQTNRDSLVTRARQAIQTNIDALALPDPTAGNNTYLGHAAIPAGTLTAAQLSTIARTLSDQVDALTRQNNALVAQTRALTRQTTALIRIALGVTDTTDGTTAAQSR